MTRGLRNNNPGNIRNSDAIDWKGEVPSGQKKDDTFEEFQDMAHGYRALIRLLQNYGRRYGCRTIPDFINRWAPNHENDTQAYIKSVCNQMQIPTTQVINVNDKATMTAFAAAISRHENGVAAVMRDVEAGWNLLNA